MSQLCSNSCVVDPVHQVVVGPSEAVPFVVPEKQMYSPIMPKGHQIQE
jgi:hypothetical protein